MHNVQKYSAYIVGQVLAGHNLNQQLKETLQEHPEFSQQQRGAIQDLCYGTLRYCGQLVKIQNELLSKPLVDNKIRNLLLISLYQLQYTKAAKYAVVDHAVSLTKQINAAANGLVNAVLRNYLRNQAQILQKVAATEEGQYSYPQWWIDIVKKEYKDQAHNILEAGNQHPPMTLRVNKCINTSQQYLGKLTTLAIEAQIISPSAILLKKPLSVENIPEFINGSVSVQDAGAQWAANLLDVTDGMRVLDACAAPGSKSAHLLELKNIKLIALDKDDLRLERVKENLQRLKLKAILLCGDASKPETWWDGIKFERILADVPCSASGVVKRHPDIKWLRRPSDIEGFAKQQEQILHALWPMLANGWKLLYATCSVFSRENQQVVTAFLNTQKNAIQMDISEDCFKNGQLMPNAEHDGFFYALLQKNA
jgi:16S rRNA (cytosine967-C5)-methyltransferase